MIGRVLVGLAVGSLAVGLAGAGSLEELLNKNYEARGGLDNLKAVRSARISGTLSVSGIIDTSITLEWKRPNKLRIEFTTPQGNGVQAFDGQTAWALMPGSPAMALPAAQTDGLRRQADVIDGPLIDWKAKGNSLEYLGEGELDGTAVEKLKLTDPNGTELTLYFDAGSFLQIRQIGTTSVQGNESQVQTTIGDYRKVGQLNLPHSIKTEMTDLGMTQQLTLKSVEFDVELPDDRFVMPATEPAGGQGPSPD
jgi:outer membrane lipoprotein-sorting protein